MARYQVAQLEQISASTAYGPPSTWAMIDAEISTRDGSPFIHSTFANQGLAQVAATAKNGAVSTRGHDDIKTLHP